MTSHEFALRQRSTLCTAWCCAIYHQHGCTDVCTSMLFTARCVGMACAPPLSQRRLQHPNTSCFCTRSAHSVHVHTHRTRVARCLPVKMCTYCPCVRACVHACRNLYVFDGSTHTHTHTYTHTHISPTPRGRRFSPLHELLFGAHSDPEPDIICRMPPCVPR